MNICVQMSSAHSHTDVRVFQKECQSLSDAGYEVVFIVPAKIDQINDGVKILSVPIISNRFRRMTQTVYRVYRRALSCKADIYHFHDPELLTVGLLLKLSGKRVVYDVHEDLPKQMLSKAWIPEWSRKYLSKLVEVLETWAAARFDAVVAVTESIALRFPVETTAIIHNYPRIEEFVSCNPDSYITRPSTVAYVGGITVIRGIKELMEAVSLLPQSLKVRLAVAGAFSPPELQMQSQSFLGRDRTDFVGNLSREKLTELLSNVRVGLVTFHPEPNHVEALPNKLFEYMAAGLPVIASDFPLWREIITSARCGLLVDPLNPRAIATAMQWLMEHPLEASEMGKRGQEAVLTRYNWASEFQNLAILYKRLLS